MTNSARRRRSRANPSNRIRSAVDRAIDCHTLPAAEVVGSARRPHVETLESRVLLSAYALRQFGAFGTNATGANPQSTLVADSNGNLFGTASAGGACGVGNVFEIAAGSGTITALASFNSADGATPSAGVTLDAARNVFGTTNYGGASGFGTAFEVASGSNAITMIASFDGNNGKYPNAGVTLDASGNLFGTTNGGGSSGDGTLFEIANGSTTVTTLASFTGSNGSEPYGVAMDAAGDLFGTAEGGGTSADGTVFELAAGSPAITTLASFDGIHGAYPDSGVKFDASGNLFGTAYGGGASGDGTVFELANGSNTITALASFNGTNGQNPYAAVTLDGSGNIYGATRAGGANDFGTVFEVARGSTAITALASFSATGGATYGGVTLGASGDLFGTTSGPPDGSSPLAGGRVFEIAAGSTAVATVAAFDSIGGTDPHSTVARDGAGDLFATAEYGGANAMGTVFEIPKGSSALTTLASFNGINGAHPVAGVTLDTFENLFGTTEAGGSSGYGTVFEIAHGSNTITTLTSFNGTNGKTPYAGVTLDASGNLFGTTNAGGASGDGTLFEIARGSSQITTLVSFSGANGAFPQGGLTLDYAGNLFGTTGNGGTFNDGIVFEVATGSASITTVAAFDGTSAKYPTGTLALDSSGNVYGVTAEQGAAAGSIPGTLFEIAAGSAAITTSAAFNGTAVTPIGLALDASGNLFGTTAGGGAMKAGMVFEIAAGSAMVTTLLAFSGSNGASPDAGVTLDGSGNLYGTTHGGGPGGYGTVFELTTNTAVTLAPTDGSNPSTAGQPVAFTATLAGSVPDGEMVTLVDASNNNAVVASGTLSSGSATLTVPAGTLSVGTHNLVAAYAGDASFAASESAAYAQRVQAPPPMLAGTPVVNGDDPNGLFTAAGQGINGKQRSMVEDIVYTFNEAVTILDANSAFTVAVAGPGGGTVPATLFAQAVAGSNGTQWAVSLTGQPVGTLASIANGEYSIQVNPWGVFAAADGTTAMTAGTGRTDTFFRLFGDIDGNESVSTLDYGRFKQALNGAYNPAFDYDGNGSIATLDYGRFKQDMPITYFGDGFVTTI
jgi:uncharacterized repeat protein (TIGR03803 family)